MKKHLLTFLLRGLVVAAGGPIVMAIIYLILGATGVVEEISFTKIGIEILTATLLAFIAAGITVVYQIERLSVFLAALIHGVALYLDYILIYLINGWLSSKLVPILIFSACFIAGYLLIWFFVYFLTKRKVKNLNETIAKEKL